MRFLVTGGAGFIGSHLVDALLAGEHQVTVLDDLSSGHRRNLAQHAANPAFQLVKGSILDPETVGQLVDASDGVFHLAAAVGVNQIVASPVRSIVTNSTGTHHVFEACSKRNVPVLLTSTSEVYGKSERDRFSEEDDLILGPTTRSRWCYAASKALDEFLALAYRHERGLPVVIVRLFNTVGPRQTGRYGMVVPRFVQQAMAGKPITVHGDGEQTRCFIHVRDIVPSLVTLRTSNEFDGEVVNLGSEDEITINELARRVLAVTGSSSPISHIPYDDAYDVGFEDMRRRRPNIDKARRLIGFSPRADLEEILRDVMEQPAPSGIA